MYLTDPTIWINRNKHMMNDTTGEMHSNTECVCVCVRVCVWGGWVGCGGAGGCKLMTEL